MCKGLFIYYVISDGGWGLPDLLQYYIGVGIESLLQYYSFGRKMEGYNPFSALKGWGQSAKLGKHSAIWGKLGTALQAYTLNPCTKFAANPTSRKVNT